MKRNYRNQSTAQTRPPWDGNDLPDDSRFLPTEKGSGTLRATGAERQRPKHWPNAVATVRTVKVILFRIRMMRVIYGKQQYDCRGLDTTNGAEVRKFIQVNRRL